MSAQYDETPEVAPQNYPEVAPQTHNGLPHYGYQQPHHVKAEGYTDSSTYAGTAPATSPYPAAASTYSQHPAADPSTKRSKGVLCGCSLLVFILSCIIALLSAAVIGLAAGTGVEANRANIATNKLAALNATASSAAAPTKTTTVAGAPTATSFNDIDRGCTNDPDGTSGTGYTSFTCRFFQSLNRILLHVTLLEHVTDSQQFSAIRSLPFTATATPPGIPSCRCSLPIWTRASMPALHTRCTRRGYSATTRTQHAAVSASSPCGRTRLMRPRAKHRATAISSRRHSSSQTL